MTNQIISKPQYGKNCKPHFWSLSNWDSWWYTPKTWSFLPRIQWKCVRTLFKTDTGTAWDHPPLGHLNLLLQMLKGAISIRFPPTLSLFCLLFFWTSPKFLHWIGASPPKRTCLFLPMQYPFSFQQWSHLFPHFSKIQAHADKKHHELWNLIWHKQ